MDIYVIIPVKQSLPVHPLIHVQVSGSVHSLLVPHDGLQIAAYKFCDIILFYVNQKQV